MKKSAVAKVIHKNKKYNRNNKQNNPKDFIYVDWFRNQRISIAVVFQSGYYVMHPGLNYEICIFGKTARQIIIFTSCRTVKLYSEIWRKRLFSDIA